jgi:hypothetical protein
VGHHDSDTGAALSSCDCVLLVSRIIIVNFVQAEHMNMRVKLIILMILLFKEVGPAHGLILVLRPLGTDQG